MKEEWRWMMVKKTGPHSKLWVHFCPQTFFHLLDFYGYSELLRQTFHLGLLENHNLSHPYCQPLLPSCMPSCVFSLLTLPSLISSHSRFVSYSLVSYWGSTTCSTGHHNIRDCFQPHTVIHSHSQPRFGASFCQIIWHCISYIWGQIKSSFQKRQEWGCCVAVEKYGIWHSRNVVISGKKHRQTHRVSESKKKRS